MPLNLLQLFLCDSSLHMCACSTYEAQEHLAPSQQAAQQVCMHTASGTQRVRTAPGVFRFCVLQALCERLPIPSTCMSSRAFCRLRRTRRADSRFAMRLHMKAHCRLGCTPLMAALPWHPAGGMMSRLQRHMSAGHRGQAATPSSSPRHGASRVQGSEGLPLDAAPLRLGEVLRVRVAGVGDWAADLPPRVPRISHGPKAEAGAALLPLLQARHVGGCRGPGAEPVCGHKRGLRLASASATTRG